MSIKAQLASGVSIIDSVEALSDWRSLLLAFFGLLIAGLLAAMAGFLMTKNGYVGGFMVLVVLIWMMTVYNAVGLQLMLIAKGQERLSFLEAYIGGLIIVPKSIGLALIIGVGYLLLMLAVLLLFFICKVPGIGPFLFTFVWPISVVTLGVVAFAILYIGFPLLGPALWEGKSIVDALATLSAIARGRAVMVVIFFLFLGFLMLLVSGLIFSVLSLGGVISMSLSAVANSQDLNANSLMGSLSSLTQGMGGLGGYGMATALGSVALVSIIGGATFLVFLRGVCLVYLQVSENLSAREDADQITGAVNLTRARFGDVAAKVKRSMDEASAKVSAGAASAATRPAEQKVVQTTIAMCPKCSQRVDHDSVFCENCGFKLG